MCGRLSIHKLEAFHALADALGIPGDRRRLDGLGARYNVGPSMPVPALVPEENGLVLEALTWGFQPDWAARKGESRLLINARAETVFTLPTFRDAVRRRRAVVLANGFYEWQRDAHDRPLQPWYVSPVQQDWIAIAAFREGHDAGHVCVLTTHPNPVMAPIHDRMPVLLAPGAIRQWLSPGSPGQLETLLTSAPEDWLTANAVSTRVNAIRHDEPALHTPVTPEAPRQGDLFH